MANKRDKKLKRQRRADRLEEKQIYKAAKVAAQHGFAISMYVIKEVFKERASNPKMEEVASKMMSLWGKLADKKVKIETIVECIEMETGISYDLKSGEIRNLRRKG